MSLDLAMAENLPARRYGDRMKRFFATVPVLAVLLAFASAAAAQDVRRVAHVGMLCASSCAPGSIQNALSDELRKLGWLEGTTIFIERKEGGGRFDRLPALAADLVRSKPDLIVAFGPQGARAIKDATDEIPIVVLLVADPVGMGLASSFARPGGNLTGVASMTAGGINGKTLSILREILPQAKRVANFINPANEMHRLLLPSDTLPSAAMLGLQLDVIEVRKAEEIPGAIATAKAKGAEALYISGDTIFSLPQNRLPELAAQAGLPSIYSVGPREIVQAGALISYGPDSVAVARRGGYYVDRILKGAKPADLPIERPTKYLLVINLKTAKSLGIEVPPSLIASADEVIE
ncbi:ABC transporter substrate-binding protein [Bradyrhizobium sp. AUGA SZCCT0182]|uniref:ABC transporter substrate-binding protein n=1 Tax=Bradyrhizobium sp. AUGA SZCCT0182 TaxID=2807667 RepID=UPI001BAB1ECA|nr:ABC transporter substrate-binding protein [Bradyrhizobium sp. AUGA SZCCT0182]MBR1235603.1 ABC transporter substrate-binding protein [Bradyrhizobium sp. AUGA SZCCT0182]